MVRALLGVGEVVCVHVYVRTCARVYVRIYTYIRVPVCIHLRACECVGMCACACAWDVKEEGVAVLEAVVA